MHEVAQVAGANTTVIGKMVRVMLLASFLMLLSAYVAKRGAATTSSSDKPGKTRLAIPWIGFGFVATVAVNSFEYTKRKRMCSVVS